MRIKVTYSVLGRKFEMIVCPECSCELTADLACRGCAKQVETVDGIPVYAPLLMDSGESFPQSGFAALFALEEGNFWFRGRNLNIIWALSKFFPSPRKLLEIGCGTGFVLNAIRMHLPSAQVFGTDLSIEGLRFARARVSNAKVLQLDACNIPYVSEFDVIAAFDVIEHIQDDVTVLQQINRALKGSGSGLILTVPQHDFLWSTADTVAKHVRRYSMQDLVAKVEAAGFSVAYKSSFVTLLLPLMLISRALNRNTAESDYEPQAEFKLPKLLNAFLWSVMQVEHVLIRAGVVFPFGGSIILVARKL